MSSLTVLMKDLCEAINHQPVHDVDTFMQHAAQTISDTCEVDGRYMSFQLSDSGDRVMGVYLRSSDARELLTMYWYGKEGVGMAFTEAEMQKDNPDILESLKGMITIYQGSQVGQPN